jgi:hypothetical protein
MIEVNAAYQRLSGLVLSREESEAPDQSTRPGGASLPAPKLSRHGQSKR